MAIKMIDLFSGIGGIRLAFENNGAKCVCSSEIDKYACQTYYENFNDKPLGDVSKLGKGDFPHFDILAGGFPCQPFSLGGMRKGFNDTRGTLFFEVARILKECKPKAFLLENVQGLVNHDKGKTIETIENVINELGYSFRWKVMNAKDYGVPQNRSRWYCIGFRRDLGVSFSETIDKQVKKASNVFYFPSECKLTISLSDIIDDVVDDCYKVSDIAISNIDKFKDAYLENHASEKPLIAYEVRPSRCSFRNDGISPCLTAKMGTGGNNVPIVVSQKRKLTERECLKIMGFPENFVIKKNSSHSYKQLGNSVVVPVVSVLAKELIRVLKTL